MSNKTSISALQELMAAVKKPLPVYIEEGFGTLFKCTVHVDGITNVGLSNTKKSAKHDSARLALENLSKRNKSKVPASPSFFKNYVGILNELASGSGVKYPTYYLLTCTLKLEYIIECSFIDQKSNGRGTNKKDAKQEAARNMLQIIDTTKDVNQDAKAINVYKTLSFTLLNTPRTVETAELQTPRVAINLMEGTVDDFKKTINQLGIEYTIIQIQANPYIMSVKTKRSNHCFLGLSHNPEHALKTALFHVLEAWNDGVDFTRELYVEKLSK